MTGLKPTQAERREQRGHTYVYRDGAVHPTAVGLPRKTKQKKRRRDRQRAKRKTQRREARKANGLPPIVAKRTGQSELQKQWAEDANGVATWERDKGVKDPLQLPFGVDREMVGAVTEAQLAEMEPEKREAILAREAEKEKAIRARHKLLRQGCPCAICTKSRQAKVRDEKVAEKR